jgi:hypothetical protein
MVDSDSYMCLSLHIEYLNLLCKPTIAETELDTLMELIGKHNKLFIGIYCSSNENSKNINIFYLFNDETL